MTLDTLLAALHKTLSSRPIVAAALALIASAGPVRADEREMFLQYGQDSRPYESYGLGLRLPSGEEKAMGGSWQASLRPEMELNHLRYSGSASGPEALNEVGARALLRLQRNLGRFQPYAEMGLGLALFDHDRLGGKHFSTHFQLAENIGLGLEFSGWFAGWRFSHYSNAGLTSSPP